MSEYPWTISPASVPPPHPKRKKPKPTSRRPRAQRGNPTLDQARLETVDLRFHHNLNDTHYGPGRVTVPHIVAQALLNQEHLAMRGEERFRRDDIGVIIGGRTAQGSVRTYEVPGATFDTHYGEAAPIERISGRGSQDPGATQAGVQQF